MKNKNIAYWVIFYIKKKHIFLIPHRRVQPRGLQHLADAIHYGMLLLYIGQEIPRFPLINFTPSQHDRNHEIRAQYARGKTERELTETFGISHQRVAQILRGKRK
jgi:hypothetical protein